jgi:hypothetical protein
MGVPSPNTESLENLKKCFLDDILKIKLSGLEQQHLSMVNIPSLFHSKAATWISLYEFLLMMVDPTKY